MREKSHFNLQEQKGATTILLAFFVMNVLLIIGLTAGSVMMLDIKMSAEIANSIPAFYAADAAAEKCLYQARYLSDNLECNRNVGAASVSLTNGASATASRQNVRINAAGNFGQTRRSLELSW